MWDAGIVNGIMGVILLLLVNFLINHLALGIRCDSVTFLFSRLRLYCVMVRGDDNVLMA